MGGVLFIAVVAMSAYRLNPSLEDNFPMSANSVLKNNVICLIHRLKWRFDGAKEVEVAPNVFLGAFIKSGVQQAINAIDEKYGVDHTWVSFSEVYVRINHEREDATLDLINMGSIITERICALIGICCGGGAPDPLYLFRNNPKNKFEGFSADFLITERTFRSGLPWENMNNDYSLEAAEIAFIKDSWKTLRCGDSKKGNADVFNRLSNAFGFYVEACNSDTLDEAIIHLAIVLESLFAPIDAQTEISHQISMNICKFLSDSPEKRKTIYTRVKNFYKCRSRIVHGSKAKEKKEVLWDAYRLAANCLARILTSSDLAKVFVEDKERKSFLSNLNFS